MASDLVQLQHLRVFSFVTLSDPPDRVHSFIEEGRDDIARELPLLERIGMKWLGWEKDPVTKEWKPVRELLRLNWVFVQSYS